ncbi:hypothetical protein AMELA_G00245390 [Ameiurus melas]|uniref:Uncharacterized protein n=1 Tax=Ameiurus melas TaxID=219545 RepID=A0A7J5ZSH5_AMEME|nr:hypothetical protein AMELA_G00245390 [Ameiurus melas]
MRLELQPRPQEFIIILRSLAMGREQRTQLSLRAAQEEQRIADSIITRCSEPPQRPGGCRVNCTSVPIVNQKMNQKMLLSRILWPAADDEYPAETNQRITGHMRQFIEMACSEDLKDLLKFWVGWEVAKESLAVEVVNGDLPRAPTYLLLYPQITRALQRLPVFQDGLDYVHWVMQVWFWAYLTLIIQQLELHISSLTFTLSLLPYSCSVNVSVLL